MLHFIKGLLCELHVYLSFTYTYDNQINILSNILFYPTHLKNYDRKYWHNDLAY